MSFTRLRAHDDSGLTASAPPNAEKAQHQLALTWLNCPFSFSFFSWGFNGHSTGRDSSWKSDLGQQEVGTIPWPRVFTPVILSSGLTRTCSAKQNPCQGYVNSSENQSHVLPVGQKNGTAWMKNNLPMHRSHQKPVERLCLKNSDLGMEVEKIAREACQDMCLGCSYSIIYKV